MKRQRSATTAADSRLVAVMLTLGRCVAPLLTRLGVDRRQFLTLLAMRARVDLRKGSRAEREGTPGMGRSLAMTIVLNLLLGLVFGLGMLLGKTPFASLFVVFALTMAIATSTLMTDHASSLLETAELQVLGPLPVGDRTVLAARVCHTLVWFLLLIGPLGLPPLLLGCRRYGPWPFAPLFVLALLAATITCLALAITALVVALHVVSPARVRGWLLCLQVLASVAVVASSQVTPLLHRVGTAWLTESWWGYLLPPAHSAALVAVFVEPGSAPPGLAVLALVVPVGLLLLLSVSAPRFQERLLALAATDRDLRARPRRRPFRDLLLRNREAIAGYDFAAAMIARDRGFRMRAWPTVAMSWLFGAWFVWNSRRHDDTFTTPLACSALYLIALSTPQVLALARFADDWRARWLFVASPLTNAANFVAGAQLALALRFVAPAALFTALLLLALVGIDLWPDVLWSLLIVAEFALLTLQVTEHQLLFCEKFDSASLQGSALRGMFYALLAGLAGWLHSQLRGDLDHFLIALAALAGFVAAHAIAIGTGMKHRPRVAVQFRDRE